MRCLNCRYDLRNLRENRCPECGRAFDPDDPKTYETPRSRVQRLVRIALSVAVRVLAIAAISLVVVYGLVCVTEGRLVAWNGDDVVNVVMNWLVTFVLMLLMYAVAMCLLRIGHRRE